MPFKPLHDKTKILEHLLDSTERGRVLTYDELSRAIALKVNDREGQHYLVSARNRCLRKGIVYVCERGLGLRRADDSAMVGEGVRRNRRMGRYANKTVRVVSSVENYDALSPEDRVRHNGALAIAAVARRLARSRKVKNLPVPDSRPSLEGITTRTLALFKGRKRA